MTILTYIKEIINPSPGAIPQGDFVLNTPARILFLMAKNLIASLLDFFICPDAEVLEEAFLRAFNR